MMKLLIFYWRCTLERWPYRECTSMKPISEERKGLWTLWSSYSQSTTLCPFSVLKPMKHRSGNCSLILIEMGMGGLLIRSIFNSLGNILGANQKLPNLDLISISKQSSGRRTLSSQMI